MGKAQSKRSVDITTETKKGTEDEITEKVGKIEDLDKKEVINGDATISEKSDPEKNDNEEVENNKDRTAEKDVDVQASDLAEPQNSGETLKDEGVSATVEEISPLSDESIKKSKKEKVKKKWSFRSISFGKKDKQKPAKNEDAAEDGSAATNGADTEEKTIIEPEYFQKDKSGNENKENSLDNHENGNATPQELYGSEQNEAKSSDEKSNIITANTTNNTSPTDICQPVQNEIAAVSSELSEKTENTAIVKETKMSENPTVDDTSKNGNGIDTKIDATGEEPQKTDAINASVETPSEKTSTLTSAVTNEASGSTNGEVGNQIHQNGDHGESKQEVVEKSKAQIEVNSNTDKVFAATLDYISSTFINPSNVQNHIQDLYASSENANEIIQTSSDQSVFKKSTDVEVNNRNADQSSFIEIVSMADAVKNKVQIVTVSDLSSEISRSDPPPPPLPISPPPSQVLAFAFTNNDDSIESSIQTRNFEPTINPIEEQKEISPPLIEFPITEIHNSQETATKIDEKSTFFNNSEQILVDEDEQNSEIQCQQNEHVEEEASVCNNIYKDSEEPYVIIEELQIEEKASVDIAAAVINDITKAAVEIVNKQLKSKEEQTTVEQNSQSNEKDEIFVVFNDNIEQFCNHKFERKDSNSAKNSPLVPEQTNKITAECSLDFSSSELTQRDQDEMISLKKSDQFDEKNLDLTKEFVAGKEIKDNITVAEITHDLSVTCE